jgi:hypothetical protein
VADPLLDQEGRSVPVPNQADDAWAELEALRAEAAGLGLEDFDGDPLAVLRARVEQTRG